MTAAINPAIDAYRQGIQQARAADNPVAEMLSTVGLAGMAFERGQLRLAVEIAEPVTTHLERSGTLPPISGVLYGVLGEAHYQWQQLEDATRYSQRALELSTLGGYKSGRVVCQIYLSRLAQMEGDLEGATRELRRDGQLGCQERYAHSCTLGFSCWPTGHGRHGDSHDILPHHFDCASIPSGKVGIQITRSQSEQGYFEPGASSWYLPIL